MQTIDGLWTIEGDAFDGSPSGGVLVCCRGHVFGGGNRYYSVGTYRLRDGLIEIETRIYHFHGAVHSRLGGTKPDFHLHFRGRVWTELIEGHVTRADEQEIRLPFRLIWRAPLPI